MFRKRRGPHETIRSAHVSLAAHRRGALTTAEQIRNQEVAVRFRVPEAAVGVLVTHLAEFRRCKRRDYVSPTYEEKLIATRSRISRSMFAIETIFPPRRVVVIKFPRLIYPPLRYDKSWRRRSRVFRPRDGGREKRVYI